MKLITVISNILFSIIILEILSLSTASSPLPWAILSHDNLGLKIIGWFFAIQSILGLLAFFVIKGIIPDKECPICNKDLKAYSSVYGPPVMCYKCRTYFHRNCYVSKGKRCPICYPEDAEGSDIPFDFTSKF